MAYSDYTDDFEDIRPYTDAEMKPVLRRISQNDWLVSGVRSMIFPRCPVALKSLMGKLVQFDLWRRLRRVKTIDQFQRKIIIDRVLEYVIKKTVESVTSSGDENLDPDAPYLYISNHRDIVLDSAFLNYVMARRGKQIAEIAFGDNLLINDFVSDLIRINRSFVVRRNLPIREKAQAALTLSRYISYTIEQGNSVWLAQREGRAKDGNDRTNPTILKMLYLAPRREGLNFNEFLERVNIIPVAVSYEFDPCDVLKARELHRTEKAGGYHKRKHEDLLSMYRGLSGWKGRVHIGFGQRIQGRFAGVTELAAEIDREIHNHYHLWPSNFIAHDQLAGGKAREQTYTMDDVKRFMQRFRRESAEVKSRALQIYANAVANKLGESPA
ncbi:MAG: 1-acyl-sn-glycerol-3-phosphate acyltransferase [Spirochaetales bacterium]|nr:1-acyl-sn-glycerol-3-phosphate acyltransferase [Spirochaetales bacterium]